MTSSYNKRRIYPTEETDMINYNGLWKILIDRGMTKTELAEKLGFGSATITRMVAGEPANLKTLVKICDYLGCKLSQICEYIPGGEK